MNKKLILILGTVILVVMFFFIGIKIVDVPLKDDSSEYHRSIYNDDKKIVLEDKYYYLKSARDEHNESKFIQKFQLFTGLDTMWNIEVNGDTKLSINYNLNIEKGDFKIVLINSKDKVQTILEGKQNGSKDIDIEAGSYTIKMVGLKAKGSVTLGLGANDKISFKVPEDTFMD